MKDKTIALRIKNLPIINKMNKIGDIYHGSSYVTCSLSLSLSVSRYTCISFLLINSTVILHHFQSTILFVSHLVYILLDDTGPYHCLLSITMVSVSLVPHPEEGVPGACADRHPILSHPQAAHPVVVACQHPCNTQG